MAGRGVRRTSARALRFHLSRPASSPSWGYCFWMLYHMCCLLVLSFAETLPRLTVPVCVCVQGVASPLDDTVRAVVLWEHTLLSQWHSSIVSAEAALPPAVPPTPAPTTLSTPLAQASPAATSQQSERKGKMYVGHGVWLPTIPAPPPRRRPVEEGMAISSGNGGATAALEPQASAITVAPITVGSGPPPPVPRRKK